MESTLTSAAAKNRFSAAARRADWKIFAFFLSPHILDTAMASQPTAILSVYNKSGLLELAKGLHAKGVKLLGSGGTAKMVKEAGIPIGCVDRLVAQSCRRCCSSSLTSRHVTPRSPPVKSRTSPRLQRCSAVGSRRYTQLSTEVS